MELLCVSKNKDGNYYFIYHVDAKRGIRRKGHPTEKELIIVGVPKEKAKEFWNRRKI